MINYLKSEMYRIFHSKGSYIFIGMCSGLLLLSNIILMAISSSEPDFGYANTAFSLGNFASNFTMIFLLCIALASMIFGNEHNNHTMKNCVSYGVSRGTIYFGKLVTEIIYAVIAFAIITGIHVASAYLMLEHSNIGEFGMLLQVCFAAFPLLLFVLAATNCFAFIIEGTGAGISAVVGLTLATPLICNFLGMKLMIFRKLAKYLPWNMINNIAIEMKSMEVMLPWKGSAGYINYWLTGLLEMVIIMIVGFTAFRKKEIK